MVSETADQLSARSEQGHQIQHPSHAPLATETTDQHTPTSDQQKKSQNTSSLNTQPRSYVANSPKDVPWYNSTAPRIREPMATLLTSYAGIPAADQVAHVSSIREKAYAVHPYPCLGLWAFLRLHLQNAPQFVQIVADLKADPNALFVDIGAGLGQEVRSLIAAGAPAERVRGVELEPVFNEFGFELFNDRERIAECMLAGDILLDHGPRSLETLYGKVSVMHAASFLHLWDWNGQVDVGRRMVRLMQDRVGVMMLGRQIGSIIAKAKVHETNKNGMTMWKHDPESFKKLWEEVGSLTGTKWDVTAELGQAYVVMDDRTGQWWHDPDTRTIVWSVVRVE